MIFEAISWGQKIAGKAIKKGSHPISFILRPVVEHKWGRFVPGLVLTIGMIWRSTPLSLAFDTDSRIGTNLALEPKISVATQISVQLPVSNFVLTQGYGFLHSGYDLAVPTGTKVLPIMGGRVVEMKKNWHGYGNMVVVDHGNGYVSRYAHLSEIWVRVGQEVELSTVLGLSGSTGRSTGPHLHLEVVENGQTISPKAVLRI